MATVDLVMPKMGESIMEATILKWHKKEGDAVKMDETFLEIATDKVDTEVPSTVEGTVTEILYKENDIVGIGEVIARIKTDAEETAVKPSAAPEEPAENNTPQPALEEEKSPAAYAASDVRPQASTPNRFYSPLVLNIAAEEGIPLGELEKIKGTGNDGRVSKKDILQYVNDRKHGHTAPVGASAEKRDQPAAVVNQPKAPTVASIAPAATASSTSGNVEIIEMDRMRKLIADHMVRSVQTSPHVTSFSEADVTNLVIWRNKAKGEFEKREGTKLTFTPLFIEAIVKCIKKYPLINSSVEGDRILQKKDINISMAAALPNGNLVVPVIKNAGQLNLVGIAKQVNSLAENARNNKLKPEDIMDGTFTMTNVGTFGSLMGTPIINQPQVAILAVGAIKKRPVVIETPYGDSIAIRHMMYLSMSYDHRIIDGSLGATFLSAVATELENFNIDREV